MTATEKTEAPTLDQRIAEALTTTDRSSFFYCVLKSQAETAADASDRTAREARAKSTDPTYGGDAIAERGRAEDNEFFSSRLRAAAASLNEKYQQAQKKELAAVWNAEAEEVEMKVAQLADELIEAYQGAAARLVDIFLRMSDMDAEVRSVNTKPGRQRTLRTTEEAARDIDGFDAPDSIVKNCALPELVIGSKAHPKMLWPPPPVNHALQYALDVGRMLGGSALPPTAEQRAVEAKRMADFYTEQERKREWLNSEAARKAAGGAG
jgi:hypothetical protein